MKILAGKVLGQLYLKLCLDWSQYRGSAFLKVMGPILECTPKIYRDHMGLHSKKATLLCGLYLKFWMHCHLVHIKNEIYKSTPIWSLSLFNFIIKFGNLQKLFIRDCNSDRNFLLKMLLWTFKESWIPE